MKNSVSNYHGVRNVKLHIYGGENKINDYLAINWKLYGNFYETWQAFCLL